MAERIVRSEQEWLSLLGPERYRLLREGGTEAPGAGCFIGHEKRGVYTCAACGNPLFSSEAKYESGSGWPSWWQPVGPDAVEYRTDAGLGMVRTEVVCARCGSHLGHVFDDGPPPTGKRH